MILSKPKAFLVATLLGLAGLQGEDVDLKKAVQSVIEAELNYAKLAAEKGFRAASIQVFADDAVVFAPGPVNGKKFWENEKDDPVLTWRPIFAAIARSGDLGYTTGPAEYRKARGDAKPAGYNDYITLWRKDAGGTWKVVIDVGVEHPAPKETPGKVGTYVPEAPLAHPELAKDALAKTEQTFADHLKTDEGAAILATASNDVRAFRRGALPAVGKTAATSMLGSDRGKTTRNRAGGGISSSIDLAYNYGEYSSERANTPERGIYLSFWRLEPNGEWKLVLDLQKKSLK